MTDREKVIKALEYCIGRNGCWSDDNHEECPWISKCREDSSSLKRDVLTLLKEQEAKPVVESTNMFTGLPITHCPKCGISLDRYLYGRQHEGQINYCSMCGQAVKWE